MATATCLSRCPSCTCKFKIVPGGGPVPARYMSIGERPGVEENRNGKCFIGKSGMEWNENYLLLAGLERDEIYVTNTVKCWAEGNRKPTEKEVRECGGHHLPHEISCVNPQVIFLMGGVACSLLPEIDLETQHGIPFMGELYGHRCWIVPMYHPASGLHDTGQMIPLLEDWENLRDWIEYGVWKWGVDNHPEPHYELLCTGEEVSRMFGLRRLLLSQPYTHLLRNRTTGRRLIAIDTETYNGQPYSLQFSYCPGVAFMLMHDSQEERIARKMRNRMLSKFDDSAISRFFGFLHVTRWEIVLHNAGQDLDTLERMGLVTDGLKFRDTMQEAYHLGNMPQGLKPLGYRLCGVKMQDYKDLVMPHSREKMREWLSESYLWVQDREDMKDITYKELKTKTKEIIKPGELEKGLARILKHGSTSATYDMWDKISELWTRVDSTQLRKLVDHMGDPPAPGIVHVPMKDQIQYACRDADITMRVALNFMSLRKNQEAEWNINQGDYDA